MNAAVSLCLIVRNEETHLPTCLGSAADLVGEIIVVDTGSTDRTKDVAARFGARVVDFPWCDDFAAARNESLRHAICPWIFWLDADERLDEANRPKLRGLFARLAEDNAAYVMKCRCLADAHSRTATVVDHVRLFRNHPDIRWQYRVHEQILPALRRAGAEVRWTDIVIDHTGYQDPALQRRKTERNLRLLHLENSGNPDDPYILFQLGWTYLELGRAAEALPFLERSRELSRPGDSFARKLYALLVRAHRERGQRREALAACRAGRARCPDDAELLFLEGLLHHEHGDVPGAVSAWRQVVRLQAGEHFASVDTALRVKARHRLALVCREHGRAAEAEAEWRAAVAEEPDFAPAWLGLGELYLAQQRWPELEEAIEQLRQLPDLAADVLVLQARGCLARKEFAAARQLLEEAIARFPRASGPHVILSHVLLQEGRDEAAAERALRQVLELDPGQMESWRNLAVLLRKQGRLAEAAAVCRSGRAHRPDDPDLLMLQALALRELGDLVNAETCLLRLLETASPAQQAEGAARHQLALVYRAQGRAAEAEAQWRALLAARPDSVPAWLGLAELCLEQGRWADLEQVAGRLMELPHGCAEAAVLRARAHLARREFAAARGLLEEAIAADPQAVWPRVVLSQALLQEGRDGAAAERVLREVLQLDPGNAAARHNLAVLLQQQERAPGQV